MIGNTYFKLLAMTIKFMLMKRLGVIRIADLKSTLLSLSLTMLTPFSATVWAEWLVAVTATSGDLSNRCIIRVANGASDNFDANIDIAAPPSFGDPPLDAYFPYDGLPVVINRLTTDARADADNIVWIYRLKSTNDGILSWDAESLPAKVKLRLVFPGGKTVDMKSQNSTPYSATGGEYQVYTIQQSRDPSPVTAEVESAFGRSPTESLKVSNLTSASATISWVTDAPVVATVNYGLTKALSGSATENRAASRTHWIEITGLMAERTYFFSLVSAGMADDNNGQFYSFQTVRISAGTPYTLYDRLSDSTGQPVIGAIVMIVAVGNGNRSHLLSALTDDNGIWSVNLGNLKDIGTGAVFQYQAGDRILVEAQATQSKKWDGNTVVSGISPKKAGIIYLSSTIDRSMSLEQNSVDNFIDLMLDSVQGLSFTLTLAPAHGALSGQAPDLRYTPDLGFQGTDSFEFEIQGGVYDSKLVVVTISVVAVNTPPIASEQSMTVRQGTIGHSINLVATDADGDSLVYSLISSPWYGTLLGTVPDLTYVPNVLAPKLGTTVVDEFSFKVNDGQVDSNIATVIITIIPTNQAPSINEDTIALTTVQRSVGLSVPFTAVDPEGELLTYQIVSQPINGWSEVDSSTVTYTPNPQFIGDDSFKFRASDGQAYSNIVTVNIQVVKVREESITPLLGGTVQLSVAGGLISIEVPPDSVLSMAKMLVSIVEKADLSAQVRTRALGPVISIEMRTADDRLKTDFHSQPLSIRLPIDSQAMTPPNTVALSSANGGIELLPTTVTDDFLTAQLFHLSYVFAVANTPPVVRQQLITVQEDTSQTVILTADDAENDLLTYSLLSLPSKGSLSGGGSSYIYLPTADVNGLDSFTFTASDGAATGSAAVVTVSINSVNDAPVAVNGAVSTDEDVPVGIVLQGTDVDGDLLTYRLLPPSGPTHGMLSSLVGSQVTYRPKTSFHGSDSFSFNVSDGILTDTGTINISFSRVNNPPVLAAIQTQTTAEDVDHMITLSATDVDGDPLVLTAESAAPELVNPVLEGANLTLEVQEDKYGETRIGVTVQDGHGGIAETTFSLMVKAANDAPVAVDGAVSTDEDVPVGIILQGTDVDGDLLTYHLLPQSGPTHGTLSSLVGSQVTYRPDADYNGTDSFQFMASDGALDSVFGTVTVDILAVNDPPVADSRLGLTLASIDDKVEVVLTGRDVDGDPLVFEIVDSPVFGRLSGTLPKLVYLLNSNFGDMDIFSFRVNDGTVDSQTATVRITRLLVPFHLRIRQGIGLVHIPLDVVLVNDQPQPIKTIGDFYQVLGQEQVSFILTYDPESNHWYSYFGDASRGGIADRQIEPDLGLITVMKQGVWLKLEGKRLDTDSRSVLSIKPGYHLA